MFLMNACHAKSQSQSYSPESTKTTTASRNVDRCMCMRRPGAEKGPSRGRLRWTAV